MVFTKSLSSDSISPTAKIISASRRTDIPAFYGRWLMQRIEAGFCHWMNPFGGQVYRVSLEPSEVIAIVFWTRNPKPLIPSLEDLRRRGFCYYFHFTINGYPRTIESHNPPIENAVETFRHLSEIISPPWIQWRYDPILLSESTPPEYHLQQFEKIAQQLAGYTHRCYFSFVDFYGKTARNLKQVEQAHDLHFERPDLCKQRALVSQLCEIGDRYGITLYSCCNDQLTDHRVQKAHCIDVDIVEQLRPNFQSSLKKAPTRQDCGCVETADIGAYDTCAFGCTYCYATNSRSAAMKRLAAHDPADSILWRPQSLTGVDLTTHEYRPKGQKAEQSEAQQTLFPITFHKSG